MFAEHLFDGFNPDFTNFETYKKSIIEIKGQWKDHTPGHFIPKEYRKPVSLKHKRVEHYAFKSRAYYPNGETTTKEYQIDKSWENNREFLSKNITQRNELCLGYIKWRGGAKPVKVELIRVTDKDKNTVYFTNGKIISVVYNDNPDITEYFNQFNDNVIIFGFISILAPKLLNPYILAPENIEIEPVYTIQTQSVDTENMLNLIIDKFHSSEIYYPEIPWGNDLKNILVQILTNPCEWFILKENLILSQGKIFGRFDTKKNDYNIRKESEFESVSDSELKKHHYCLTYLFYPEHDFLKSKSMRNKCNKITRKIESGELTVKTYYGHKELLAHIDSITEFIDKWVIEYGREKSVTYDAFFTNLVKVLNEETLEKLDIQTILVWDRENKLQGYYISMRTAKNIVDTLQGQSLKEVKNLQDWSNWYEIKLWREKNPQIIFNRGCSPIYDTHIHRYNMKLHPSLIIKL